MIELIGGGARSGKSSEALRRAELAYKTQTGRKLFIATAIANDDSMAARIALHKSERDESWQVIEEQLKLTELIEDLSKNDCAIIDCLTLWISNWLCNEERSQWLEEKHSFLKAIQSTPAHVIMVTNEVGQGVIPMGELSRDFVDESGWLHQSIAAVADSVVMMQFGLAQNLK